MAPSFNPPSSPGQDRRGSVGRHGDRVETPPQTIDDAQLAQDIDAARQMSRARASSITHHPHAMAAMGTAATGAATTPGSQGLPHSPHGFPLGTSSNSGGGGVGGAGSSSMTAQHPSNAADISVTDHQSTSPRALHAASYSRSPSSPLAAFHQQQQQQHQQQEAQAQAARFYMQHRRQGSNSSLDSASHFIDHRNQQASVPQMSPQTYQRGSVSRRSQSRMESFSLGESRLRHGSSALEGSALDEDTSRAHVNDPVAAGSYLGRSFAGQRPSILARGSRGGRLVDIGGEDNNEEHNGASALSPQNTVSERPPHTPSRRPSLAEEDVWFPMHAQAGETQGHEETHQYEEHHVHGGAHSDHEASTHHLPPGFPFTFDLGTLEEYVEQERKKAEEDAAENQTGGFGMRRRGATSATAVRTVKDQAQGDAIRPSAQTAFGVSPSSDDATFYSRRPRKFINVPGIEPEGPKSSNRYQRKLAMFEGPGSSPPPASARGGGGNILGSGSLLQNERERHQQQMGTTSNGFALDNKSPAPEVGGRSMPGYYGGEDWNTRKSEDDAGDARPVSRSLSMGADLGNLVKRAKGTSRPLRGAGVRSTSFAHDRQYRFTFYSNALPNTIHARHLYELPAAGQTFEELLMGISPEQQREKDEEEDLINMNDPVPAPHESDVASAAPQSSAAATAAAADQSGGPRSSTRQASALTNIMNAGRLEGSTAPNTGSNTPDHSAPRSSLPGKPRNMGARQDPATAANGAGFVPAGLSTAQLAAIEKTRTLPGGGLRVDQDSSICTWWLDVLCPTDQEMKMLSRVFGIHPLTTEDILMEETREKIELFRNYYLVCFRSFDQDPYSPTYLEPLNMYVIVFREGTLSFHFRATPHPVNVRRRIKQLKDYINVTSDWISYALIDDITDAFGPLIQSIEYEVDSIDELVLILKEAEQSDMLRRIGTCRKKVMGLLRLMGNKADVVKGLAKRCNENWSVAPKSDIGLYLSDIQDHLITMTQNLNHYEKILSRSHSNYLAQISIEMTDANNQINDVLSKLTALGTVIVPLNVITGLWGMNVNVPGQGVESLDWFFGIIAVMVALAVVGYFATIRYLSR